MFFEQLLSRKRKTTKNNLAHLVKSLPIRKIRRHSKVPEEKQLKGEILEKVKLKKPKQNNENTNN